MNPEGGRFVSCEFVLVKKTRSALELMPAAICDLPYEGAKEMLLVDEVDSKAFLTKLFEAMYDELPLPKQKQKNNAVRNAANALSNTFRLKTPGCLLWQMVIFTLTVYGYPAP